MFYGIYQSAERTKVTCTKRIATVPQDEMTFPGAVNYDCSLCEARHAFNFLKVEMASTPRQHKKTLELFDSLGIEHGISLTDG
jgi:hypothetical protein